MRLAIKTVSRVARIRHIRFRQEEEAKPLRFQVIGTSTKRNTKMEKYGWAETSFEKPTSLLFTALS